MTFSGLMFIGTPCSKNVKKYHLSANNTAHQATSMDSNSNLQSAEFCTKINHVILIQSNHIMEGGEAMRP